MIMDDDDDGDDVVTLGFVPPLATHFSTYLPTHACSRSGRRKLLGRRLVLCATAMLLATTRPTRLALKAQGGKAGGGERGLKEDGARKLDEKGGKTTAVARR